jgi:hypothetical protein
VACFFQTFFKLLIGHALADFALQSDVMAKFKNRHNKATPPVNQKYVPCWPYWLLAHGLIHAGMVVLITNNYWFALGELFSHCLIDFLKCEGTTNPHVDQALHVLFKLVWAVK